MKIKTILSIVALAAMLAVPQGVKADAVYKWTASQAVTVANTVVELVGCTVTLGNTTWTYQNSSLSPADMPMTDETSNQNGVTSFKDGDAIPGYGAVLKIEPTKSGVITITGKDCAYAAQKVYFVLNDGTTKIIEQAAGKTSGNTHLHAYDVEADKTYYFFQTCKDATTTSSNRFTLKSIEFSVPFAYNFIEENGSDIAAEGTYGEMNITTAATWDGTNKWYNAGVFEFKTANAGYLVVEGKGASTEGFSLKLNGSSSGENTGINNNNTNLTVYTARLSSGQYATINLNTNGRLVAAAWVPDSSAIARLTKSVTLDANGFATYTPFYSVTIPDGLEAYSFSALNIDGSAVTAAAVATTIPANTAVLLKGTASTTYNFTAATGNTATIGNHNACGTQNVLRPAFKAIEVPTTGEDVYYAYSKSKGGFTKVKGGLTIPQGKCYFKVTGGTAGAREVLSIDWDGNGTTAISEISNMPKQEDGIYYNLRGQRVENPTKGLYIVNGKKVVIK